MNKVRRLVLVLGDQLNADSAGFDDFDAQLDAVLMIEAKHEATYVTQHKLRLVLFFSAMRHFRDELLQRGITVHYAAIESKQNQGTFREETPRWIRKTRAETLVVVQPGDYRVLVELREALQDQPCKLDLRRDRHFMCTEKQFEEFAEGRKSLLMEHFYRDMRRRHGVLLESDKTPVGGKWNYDAQNRQSFDRKNPPKIKAPRSFRADETTRKVARMVDKLFRSSPGRTADFDYPVTRRQARAALRDFVESRLDHFGPYQDAMLAGAPYLYHSRLSSSLNLHLLDPRDAIAKAVESYESGSAALNSTEGFVRQLLGWREFIRGIYWREMPEYADRNTLEADLPMPAFMWTAETEMNCLRQCVLQLLDTAYAHHIQRLMVLGLFCLLLGVRPQEVNRWHLSMYIDAIDWVSLPNVLGMSQYADDGLLASKPYCASGAYVQRMSNYCEDCRYDPGKASGDSACPLTTLYWDFLSRHRDRLHSNPRMKFQYANLQRKPKGELQSIKKRADQLKAPFTGNTG